MCSWDIQNNLLTMENILTQLEDNQIVAPMDAVVLNVNVKPGDGVSQGGAAADDWRSV